jgi:hypothetical protein
MKKFCCVMSLLLLTACSSERPAGTDVGRVPDAESKAPGASPSVLSAGSGAFSLEITPPEAMRNSTLYLNPKGFNLGDAKIEWLVNGETAESSAPNYFKAAEVRKGEGVQAKATLQEREIFSNIVLIKNAPPDLRSVKMMPEVFKPGDTLYVDVTAGDIDDDEVTIDYEWTKNGEPAGKSKTLEVPLKRGDKISVRIIPFDGEAYGRAVTLEREIRNIPPMISEDRKFNFDGNIWTYQVRAADADGDPLTYSLKSGPQGMTIGAATGAIKWDVPSGFTGKAPVTVSVTDGHGGEVLQSFTVEIRPEQK